MKRFNIIVLLCLSICKLFAQQPSEQFHESLYYYDVSVSFVFEGHTNCWYLNGVSKNLILKSLRYDNEMQFISSFFDNTDYCYDFTSQTNHLNLWKQYSNEIDNWISIQEKNYKKIYKTKTHEYHVILNDSNTVRIRIYKINGMYSINDKLTLSTRNPPIRYYNKLIDSSYTLNSDTYVLQSIVNIEGVKLSDDVLSTLNCDSGNEISLKNIVKKKSCRTKKY